MRRVLLYGGVLGIALIVGAIGIDVIIETDEEQVEAAVGEIRDAARSGDLSRTLPLIDIDGAGFELLLAGSRERYGAADLDLLEDRLIEGSEWLDGADIRFDSPTITIDGSRAHAYFRMYVDRDSTEIASTTIDLTLRHVGEDWLVTRLRSISERSDRSARR